MKTITIKTYKMNSQHSTLHFFILSKGYNAGKPMESACPNCFIITAASETEKRKLYWVCYSLWISGCYIPYLCGSVIPFLHINDTAAIIQKAYDRINPTLPETTVLFTQLSKLIHLEKHLQLQQKLIDQMKKMLANKIVSGL